MYVYIFFRFFSIILVVVLVVQLCLTLCDLMDCSPPGSSVHVILQARILEWIATSFSNGSSLPRDWTHVSYISCIISSQASHLGSWVLDQNVHSCLHAWTLSLLCYPMTSLYISSPIIPLPELEILRYSPSWAEWLNCCSPWLVYVVGSSIHELIQ